LAILLIRIVNIGGIQSTMVVAGRGVGSAKRLKVVVTSTTKSYWLCMVRKKLTTAHNKAMMQLETDTIAQTLGEMPVFKTADYRRRWGNIDVANTM